MRPVPCPPPLCSLSRELRYFRKSESELMRCLRIADGLNTITRRGEIGTSLAVLKLRPILWPFLRTTNEPNDESFTVSPRSRQSVISSYSEQLAALTVRHAVPTVYARREFAAAGGLLSYGLRHYRVIPSGWILYRRVLKGEKPADLPVQQSTKVELILNLKTAKALGITVPLPLSGRADEVIE